ncbi:MAG: hypothetical protein HRU15_01200 [Planctomycetes bacterium]|nr:hypothetical protein [Planctomycetota bacterium]
MNWTSLILLTLCAFCLIACGGSSSGTPASSSPAIVQRGDRLLSIDISLPEDNDFTAAYNEAILTDMDNIKLSFDWSMLEDGSKTGGGAPIYDMSIPAIAESYYPAQNMPVSIFIRPVHINIKPVPSDLSATEFDDASMIQRFKDLLDTLFATMPTTDIHSLIIGSEIDIYFANDDAAWDTYITFYNAVATYAKAQRPGILVGSEVTYDFYDETSFHKWTELNTQTDFIGISYYGIIYNSKHGKDMSQIANDFDDMVAKHPGNKAIFIPQLGYPSSTSLSSSETQQAEFIDTVYAAWDKHYDRIKLINFTWMHEWDATAIADFLTQIGVSDPDLVEFLSSIGLRNRSGAGTDKLAWPRLKDRSAERGWIASSSPIHASN